MAALAGMMTDGVGQLDYLLERLQERPAEDAAAVFAAGRVVSEGLEIVRFAERTGQGMRLGGEGVCHLLFLSDLFRFPSDHSTEQMRRAWLKNTVPCDSLSARAQSWLRGNLFALRSHRYSLVIMLREREFHFAQIGDSWSSK
jgi:hypothetical protein